MQHISAMGQSEGGFATPSLCFFGISEMTFDTDNGFEWHMHGPLRAVVKTCVCRILCRRLAVVPRLCALR